MRVEGFVPGIIQQRFLVDKFAARRCLAPCKGLCRARFQGETIPTFDHFLVQATLPATNP